MAPKRPAKMDGGAPSAKRKRVALTIAQKVELLKKLDRGVSVRRLSEEYDVGASTIYDLKKQKEQIFKYFAESDSKKRMENRKNMRKGKFEELEKCLFQWFIQHRNEGLKISGDMLLAQARIFHEQLNMEGEFTLSTGWLDRFKKRHGIDQGRSCGEARSADHNAAKKYVDTFAQLVKDEGLSPEQVYNADETALYWRCMPHKTLKHEDETDISGYKEPKDRITILTCSNAAGTHRCKNLVIGKSQRPRALKGVRTLPVLYRANKKAWMTQKMMLEWYENHFVPEARAHCSKVGLPPDCRILLILDNCSGHPPAEQMMKDNVFVAYLPPNCTSLIQPQDRGIIRSFKSKYRRVFMRKLLYGINDGKSIVTFRKEFNIKNVLYAVANAWDSVNSTVLKNCWHKLWPAMDDPDDSEADFEGFGEEEVDGDVRATVRDILNYARDFSSDVARNLTEENLEEWMAADDDAQLSHQMSSEEIVRMVTTPDEELSEDDDEDDDDDGAITPVEKISLDRTIELTELLIEALEQRTFVSEQMIMQVYNLQGLLIREKPKHQKQLKIQDLFKKMASPQPPSEPQPGPSSAPDPEPQPGPSSAPDPEPQPGPSSAPDPEPQPGPSSRPGTGTPPPETPDLSLPGYSSDTQDASTEVHPLPDITLATSLSSPSASTSINSPSASTSM